MLIPICFAAVALLQAQVAKQSVPENPISDADGITSKSATNGFFRGRLLPGKSSPELRRRAFKAKLSMRAQHAASSLSVVVVLSGRCDRLGSPKKRCEAQDSQTKVDHRAGSCDVVAALLRLRQHGRRDNVVIREPACHRLHHRNRNVSRRDSRCRVKRTERPTAYVGCA
jgi:hypothetical protein